MKKVILDTSFILTAIRNKLDFLEEIKFLGLQAIIPKQVIDELKKIIESKKKLRFKDEAKIAIRLFKKRKVQKIDLKANYVDKGVINYAKKNKEAIIATLDRELKMKIPNKKLIIRGKKKLEII